ncbi:asparagine synthase-related protein [Halobacillus trueperi]|uniref:asparagine synthase-related protein n=1 Tax=Halobacillus trueperi TaxID=156205 RepID=UPI0037353C5A
MSAIAGIFNMKNEQSTQLEHCNEMMGTLKKYPADDIQTWNKDNVFLGCHAQWITPESVGEKLPYYDQDRKLAITADVIIDNRDDLLDILMVSKAIRKNIPDSKIILLAYEKWGEACTLQLVGDFAFVIWDETQNKLFGARDFSGSRTLYYQIYNNHFSFCTLIEPLLSLSNMNKELNDNWLAEFMTIPNMIDSSDPSITPYKNIYQLKPSHTFTLQNGKFHEIRYDALGKLDKFKFHNNEEYVEAFQDVFQTAVNSRIRSRKKVSAQLSGGLDSSAVVSFAARELSKNSQSLNTFSYIPEENFQDWTPKHRLANEASFIKATAGEYGNINSHFLSFPGRNSYKEIDEWLDIMEMPYKFFENSFWIRGIYEESYKQHSGVLLNGSRGNYSISWGPALYYYSLLLKRFNWIKLYKEINCYSANMGIPNKKRILKFIGRKALPDFIRKSSNMDYSFPNFLSEDYMKRVGMKSIKSHERTHNSIQDRLNHFQNNYVWNATGIANTKLSLRYGIWNRDPTNDLRVIKYCLSIPIEQYVHNGMDRALVRNATKGLLPEEVRFNQKIRGIQAADWLFRMRPSWGDFITELKEITQESNYEYFNYPLVREILKEIDVFPADDKAFDPGIRGLMRVLIVYRFIKKLRGGDTYEKGLEKASIGNFEY